MDDSVFLYVISNKKGMTQEFVQEFFDQLFTRYRGDEPGVQGPSLLIHAGWYDAQAMEEALGPVNQTEQENIRNMRESHSRIKMFAKEHNYNLTALDKIVLEWWKWQYKQALQEHYKELETVLPDDRLLFPSMQPKPLRLRITNTCDSGC